MAKREFLIKFVLGGEAITVETEGYMPETFRPVIHKDQIRFVKVSKSNSRKRSYDSKNATKSTISKGWDDTPEIVRDPLNTFKKSELPEYTGREEIFEIGTPADLQIYERGSFSPSLSIINKGKPSYSLPTPEFFEYNLKDGHIDTFTKTNTLALKKENNKNSITRKKSSFVDMPSDFNLNFIEEVNSTRTQGREFSPVKKLLKSRAFEKRTFSSTPRILDIERPSFALSTPDFCTYTPRNAMLNTITKWRKCLTPIKTYLKRPLKDIGNVQHSPYGRKQFNAKGLTKGYEGEKYLKILKIHKILDEKVVISPKTFKKQLTDTADIISNEKSLPKTKIEFFTSRIGSFKLITNSARQKCMADNLKKMFGNRCVQKHTDIDSDLKNELMPEHELTLISRKIFT